MLFVKIDDNGYSDVPSISISFKVSSDLDVSVFFKNLCLPEEKFSWLLSEGSSDLKCDRWSKLDNLVSCLSNYSINDIVSLDEKVAFLVNNVKEGLLLDFNLNVEKAAKVKFALEQLELSFANQIKYSAELLIWAASLSYSHPGAYQSLRKTNMMTLPHHIYLRQFLSKIGPNSPGIGPLQKSYLKEKSKLLKNEEKVVTVMLDEIYVNPKLSYKAGKIIGTAENVSGTESATTMQAFMFSSLHSDNKDIIAIFPVKNMNANTLLTLTTEVLKLMNELQFDVVCLISDNHSTNRKMFELLGGGMLKTCVSNPADPSKSLFLLFDSVHLLKCIRNNWLNRPNEIFILPDTEQTFPKITAMRSVNEGKMIFEYTNVEAKLSDLKDLFHSEKNSVLKLAPNLSRKALYPTAIERQNVTLAISIFDFKNIVSLDMLKSEGVAISDGTIQFLKVISKWWTICNVQHPMKGTYNRNADAHPINGPDDAKLMFLENLKTYIDIWHTSNTDGRLSNETFLAFTHTLTAVVELCKYIFSKYKWPYILTAKLQTDSLESRFGAYRRLSGCTYNVSVEQVLESERRLKVLSFLKLTSAKVGEFTLKDLTTTFIQEKVAENLDKLQSALDETDCISIPIETQKIIVCIASYTSMKVVEKLGRNKKCTDCKQMLQTDEDMDLDCNRERLFTYFRELNRGGLKYPSSFLMCLCCDVYRLMQVLISNRYEQEFLNLKNQRDAVVTLSVQFFLNSVSNIDDSCSCGVRLVKIVKKCVKVFANIFINNYTQVLNDKNVSKELARKLGNRKRRQASKELAMKVKKRKELKFSTN